MVLTLRETEFAGRRIAVVGMARTGLAAAPVLRDLGAQVLLSDAADRTALGDRLAEAEVCGVEVRTGAGPEEALEGAELVVPSPGIPMDAPVLRLARRRGLPILSEIEVAYRIARAPILAVTGTNGKTTTTLLLGEMTRAGGKRTWVAGNVAADEIKQALITAAARAEPDDVIVAEVSSFQLEWVERFRPKVGILTNVTPDHLDRHATFAEYIGIKARLFDAQAQEDVAVINAVNAPSRGVGQRVYSRVLWFDRGLCPQSDSACVRGGQIVVRWDGIERVVCPVEALRLPGAHNLENALAAAGAAVAFGIDPADAGRAIAAFHGVVHRMEPVAEIGGVTYINNSMCTNVDAAVRSLETLRQPVVVIAGGVDKSSDFAPFGRAIARQARHLVLIGRDAPAIEAAAQSAGFTAISHAASMEEAVDLAARAAQPGDVVILSPACASRDMFADFEARGEAFRRAVRNRWEGKS